MSQPTYGIAITADDKTAKGVASAERRLGKLSGRAGRVNARAIGASEKSIGRSGRSIVRTFAEAEKAGARIFGGRSIMAGVGSRMAAIGDAASAMGTGMGAAAAEGGILTGIIGGVGAAVAGVVGVMAAGVGIVFKLADGWARSAAQMGRTAEIIGVGTKALQEFNAAAERQGVDKDKATGSLGGLSQNLNDARYGRNSAVMAVLARMGVQLKTKADGTVDVEGMLPAIADALQRQNSSGRRTAARLLGISLDTLPAFTQGGKALSADMADSDATATVLTDGQIDKAKRQARKSVMRQQLTDLGMNKVSEGASDLAEPGNDALIAGGRWIAGAQTIDRAGGKMDRAANKMERAADRMGSARPGGVSRAGLTREAIAAAQESERKYGVPASISLAQYGLESAYGRRMPAGSNNPFGMKARRGDPYVTANTTENIGGRNVRTTARFRVFSSLQEAFDEHAKLLAQGRYYKRARAALPDVGRYADELGGGTAADPRYATDPRYGQKIRGLMARDGLTGFDGGRMPEVPVKVEIEMRGAPPGTRAKVTSGSGRSPATSFAFEPVRGG